MYAQLPRFETRLPARRPLERDYGHLARMLWQGISALDVGCANGAITAGIAEAVGPDGNVVGVDRDALTAARVLQWIADPALALARMKAAAKPNGKLVVLDFKHAKNKWQPQPRPEFSRFYQAFLDWRRANQWDNEMADHLLALFRSAGLVSIAKRLRLASILFT